VLLSRGHGPSEQDLSVPGPRALLAVPPSAAGRTRRLAALPKRSVVLLGVCVAALLLTTAGPAAATTLPTGFEESLVASGGDKPVAAAFAPDGRKFMAEKGGKVRVATAQGTVLSTPLLDISARVNSYSDRGLLGIATDKDFASNGYLYLLYVYELDPLVPDSSGPMVSRLTRVTVNPDNTLENPSDPETVILGKDVSGPCPEPDNTRDCIPADYKWHVIGTVRSDPEDGTLWVGTGDTHAPLVDARSYRPYDESTFAGKIIHVERNGQGLSDHPFCSADTNLSHTCTKLYAKGFRNPFRFSVRSGKGPVVGDVGNSAREELDLLKPGRNYGWPCYEGDVRTPLYDQETRCQQEYAKEGTADAAAKPAWSYPHGTGAAVVGGPAYTGTRYPAEYRGNVFVGDYVQGWVKALEVDQNDEVTKVKDFATGWPAGVALEEMPDNGDVGYVDIAWGMPGAIRRFSYTGSVNAPPTARASATPSSGGAPLDVAFSSSGSTDPDGDTLTYDWNFGDGSPHSAEPNPSHTYSSDGSYTARLTVADGNGHTAEETVAVRVGNTAPTPSISAPVDESTYRGGVEVQLRGSATDSEDGAVPESGLSWQVLLHHNTHIHEQSTGSGSQASFTPLVDHDADSYYEVRLTATDSEGLQKSGTVQVRPETRKLTLASSPAGAPIGYAGQQDVTAPFTRESAVGFRTSVSAAVSFTKDGLTYRFQGWSDGGAQQHTIEVPATDSTLTASYARERKKPRAPRPR